MLCAPTCSFNAVPLKVPVSESKLIHEAGRMVPLANVALKINSSPESISMNVSLGITIENA